MFSDYKCYAQKKHSDFIQEKYKIIITFAVYEWKSDGGGHD